MTTENVVGLLMIIVTIVITFYLVRAMVRGVRGRRYHSALQRGPTVEGRILTARVVSEQRRQGDDYMTVFMPAVTYTYTVADREYEAKDIIVAGMSSGARGGGERAKGVARFAWQALGGESSGKADEWVESNPPGTPISVVYNPAQPEQSDLLGNRRSVQSATNVIGVGCFLPIIWLFGIGYGLVFLFAD